MNPILQLGCALRAAWAEGYDAHKLRTDVLAGLVVGVVALPLSMALAIASGAPPQHGLYTAIVAGGVCALLGGSRVLVTGPTAAFVVILAPIAGKFGLAGLVMASALAGLMLIAMGVLRLGRLIQFMPYPVTTGFTAGIGIVIASQQVKDFLGLSGGAVGADAMWHERMVALAGALPTLHWPELLVGAATLAVLIAWRRIRSILPAPLIALAFAALLGLLMARQFHLDVATLSSRFGTASAPSGIPRLPPQFTWPWNLPGAAGSAPTLSLAYIQSLLPSAFAIAMLGAIESLLAAVVADGMTGLKHDSDVELTSLGIANVAASLFGGFAATGAIARTATNARAGGRSPVAAIVHSAFVLAAMMLLAPLLGYVPMAAMAAMLLLVAWDMSEPRHVLRMLRIAPRADVAVLLTCLVLTVAFNMTIAVTVGVLMAAVLFMRRMIEISGTELIGPSHPEHGRELPKGVVAFDIGGPLFFGAAHKAMSELVSLDRKSVKLVLVDLEDVPAIDATGIVNLRSAVDRLRSGGIAIELVGLQAQPRAALERAGLLGEGGMAVHATFADALADARRRFGGSAPASAPATD
jgi:SulP family sulfate permease